MIRPVQSIDLNAYWGEALTHFAFRVYAEKKIETLCLRLQKTYGVNVNITLWALWLKSENINLHRDCLDEALVTVDSLSQVTVNRLREIRLLIKDDAGFNRVQSSIICKHILNAEVSAEKILLQRLQDLTSRFLDARDRESLHADSDTAPMTIDYYLEFMKVPDAHLFADSLSIFCDHVHQAKTN